MQSNFCPMTLLDEGLPEGTPSTHYLDLEKKMYACDSLRLLTGSIRKDTFSLVYTDPSI